MLYNKPAVDAYFTLVVNSVCANDVIPIIEIFNSCTKFFTRSQLAFELIAEWNDYMSINSRVGSSYAPITI
jgi:hypothetical protein